MIILDGPPDPQKRRVSRRSSTSTSEVESIRSSEVAPPSYRSSNSRHSLQPMLEADPPSSLRSSTTTKVQKAWPRFRKGLLYALAVYAVVTVAVAVPYFVTQNRRLATHTPYQRMRPPDPATEPGDKDGTKTTPVNVPSSDGNVLGCNVWDYSHEYGYPDDLEYSRLTYCIPSNTTDVWLHALGGGERFVSGDFIVKLNPDAAETDYMVDIMLTYPAADNTAKDSSAICLMQANGTWGVGIYTPPDSSNHSLDYQLTFLVPQNAKTPLLLSQFTTYLPWFSHSFRDLNASLIFGNVEVGGIGSPVDGTIQAEKVNVTTSRAPITGSYRATDTLILQTSYAKIDTNITLSNRAGQEGATSLYMRSSDGPFSATVNLSTSPPEAMNMSLVPRNDSRPQYTTRVSCDDSPVTLIFRHDDSVDSSDLDVQVNTTLNRAIVLLDSKFEGNFDLYSKDGSVLVTDLDGDQHQSYDAMSGAFPDYRRNLVYERESTSRTKGCVKRAVQPRDSDRKANVKVQNNLALIALGFLKSDDEYPAFPDLNLAQILG